MGTRTRQLAVLLASLSIIVGACGRPDRGRRPRRRRSRRRQRGARQRRRRRPRRSRSRSRPGPARTSPRSSRSSSSTRSTPSQTEFEIVHEPAPADYYTKLQTGLAGGTGADLIWLSQEYIAGYASRGALLDLTDPLADDRRTRPPKSTSYFPDVIKTAVYQDKVYGLPWISQPVLLYYNPALFDAAGIAYPDDTWDWDEVQPSTADQGHSRRRRADQYGFTANGWPPIQMFIWQAGGEVITPDLTSSPIDTPEAIAGAEFYATSSTTRPAARPRTRSPSRASASMFKAGKVAMFIGGAVGHLRGRRRQGLDIRRRRSCPRGRIGTTFAWTASTVVNAHDRQPRARRQGAGRADRGHPPLEDRRAAHRISRPPR